jgi:hypothetical protein
VGQPGYGDACVVGYVDARKNGDANELARSVADMFAESFVCRVNGPMFHGDRGPLADEPVRTFGP